MEIWFLNMKNYILKILKSNSKYVKQEGQKTKNISAEAPVLATGTRSKHLIYYCFAYISVGREPTLFLIFLFQIIVPNHILYK